MGSSLTKAASLQKQGRTAEAIQLFQTLISENPDNPELQFKCGVCFLEMGEYFKALGYLLRATELDSKNAEYHAWLGKCLSETNLEKSAIKSYKKALSLDEFNLIALSGLGYIYAHNEKNSEAKELLKRALTIQPTNITNLGRLAIILSRLDEYEEAIEHAQKAIKLEPKNPFPYISLGNAQLIHADTVGALNSFRKAIEANPMHGRAYFYYFNTKKTTNNDITLIKKMEKMLEKSMPAQTRQDILYSLGKAFDDLKEHEKAFSFIEKANMLAQHQFNSDENRKTLKKIKQIFTRKYLNTHKIKERQDCSPIFIIGMPRSGSTLIDQILSSHPKVCSIGESTKLLDILSEVGENKKIENDYLYLLRNLNCSDLTSIQNQYFDEICNLSDTTTHIVNKTLSHFRELGLISVLFPNARIIHAKRHPLDIGLSCFFIAFNSKNMSWANDLSSIGEYYRSYADLMGYWKKTLSIPILDIQYEDIITDIETHSKRIIEFCGLDWNEKCLEFYKTKRGVHTASVWQVRQPVYKSSMQRWAPYAKNLQPLILALGDLLADDFEYIESLGLKHGRKKKQFHLRLFR